MKSGNGTEIGLGNGIYSCQPPFCVKLCKRFVNSFSYIFFFTGSTLPADIKIGMTSAYALIFIVALFGNSFGLYVVLKKSKSTSATNLFIANMAIADLMLTVTLMPFQIAYFHRGYVWIEGTMGTITCKAVNYVFRVSIAASVLAMTFISFDRFYAVFYPMKRKFFRKPRFVSTAIWFFSFILMFPTVLYFQVEFNPSQNAHECRRSWSNDHVRTIFHIGLFILLYALPLVIMTVLYILICRKLWLRKIPGNASQRSQAAVELSKRKVVRLLVIVVVAFALCWLPTYVNHYFLLVRPERGKYPLEVQFVFFWLAHANSAINPCLYILFYRNFRRTLVSMFSCC